jgi:hypothetical protein
MKCQIHSVPGRLRVRIPEAKRWPGVVAELVQRLKAVEGIGRVETNSLTGSILMFYDDSVISAGECLAILNVRANQSSLRSYSPADRITTKMAEAALWYVVEKALERSLLLLLAAVF